MTFNKIRQDVELIFVNYRKHKYYTLFKNDIDINVSITSKIDEIGGGKSNETSDSTADAAIKIVDEKLEAERIVKLVEQAVEQLPDIEKELIKLRYMSRNHNYISDYTVYEIKMNPPISRPTYIKIRERAFNTLYTLLSSEIALQ